MINVRKILDTTVSTDRPCLIRINGHRAQGRGKPETTGDRKAHRTPAKPGKRTDDRAPRSVRSPGEARLKRAGPDCSPNRPDCSGDWRSERGWTARSGRHQRCWHAFNAARQRKWHIPECSQRGSSLLILTAMESSIWEWPMRLIARSRFFPRSY